MTLDPEAVARGIISATPELPRMPQVLHAEMDPMEIIEFAPTTPKYTDDGDFHLLVDHLRGLFTALKEQEAQAMAERERLMKQIAILDGGDSEPGDD